MTRGEAIQWLEWCRDNYFLNAPIKWDVAQASRMAIQALSAEPCEDAISRAWLKEAIHNFYYGLKHTPTEEDIQAYIDAAPSVTPKQKMGHWVKISPAGIYECSECGQNVMTGDIDAYRHCHGCGARMAESEDI